MLLTKPRNLRKSNTISLENFRLWSLFTLCVLFGQSRSFPRIGKKWRNVPIVLYCIIYRRRRNYYRSLTKAEKRGATLILYFHFANWRNIPRTHRSCQVCVCKNTSWRFITRVGNILCHKHNFVLCTDECMISSQEIAISYPTHFVPF